MNNIKLIFLFLTFGLILFSCSNEPDQSKKYNPVINVTKEMSDNISMNLILPDKIEKNQPVTVRITTDTNLPLEISIGYRTAGLKNWKMKSLRFNNGAYEALIPGHYSTGKGIEIFFLYSVPGSEKQFFYATSENPQLIAVHNLGEKSGETASSSLKVIKNIVNTKKEDLKASKSAQDIFNSIVKEEPEPEPNVDTKAQEQKIKEVAIKEKIIEKTTSFKTIDKIDKEDNAKPEVKAAPSAAKPVLSEAAKDKAPVETVQPQLSPRDKALKELNEKGILFNADVFVNAAKDNKVDLLKLMIDAGMKPDVKNSDGRPAIVAAASKGSLKAVEFLIKSGADVDLPDKKGDTALMKATYRNELDVIALLLRAGANMDLKNNEGSSAYLYAEKKEMEKVLEIMHKKGKQ